MIEVEMKNDPSTQSTADEYCGVALSMGAEGSVSSETISQRAFANFDKTLGPLRSTSEMRRAALAATDLCLDPLMFVVNPGLPRLRELNKQIGRGGSFHLAQRLAEGAITFLPRILELWKRRPGEGLRMVKTVDERNLFNPRGYLIRGARGVSLDVSNGAEA